jgi:hypothetical protein
MDELAELAARIEQLPDDAQQALAWQVLKRFGYETPEEEAARHAEWVAQMQAEREALFAWEKVNGLWPGGYRAAG